MWPRPGTIWFKVLASRAQGIPFMERVMTTTVTVKAHNNPATVTVTSRGANMSSRSVYKLRDGQEGTFTVSDTQSVKVEERAADKEPTGEN